MITAELARRRIYLFCQLAMTVTQILQKQREKMSAMYETPEAIVAGVHRGDANAERALITKYERSLAYILERRTQNKASAEDLRQDTFIIVLERLRRKPIDDPAKLSAYLHNTAIKLHIGELRKRTRRKTAYDTELVNSVEGNETEQFEKLNRSRARKSVREIIAEMDNLRDRQVLTQHYVHDRQKAEICADLKLDKRHFDRVISRARKRFKQLVESEYMDLLKDEL